ncbi:SIR2 family protein [Leisingera sp. JC11]|uniref:SIR2 family NAD-dependent protein deacylase n=1 Tax=Leisingera sp. JC11 TaxID=3042469 RepID=UPI003452BA63
MEKNIFEVMENVLSGSSIVFLGAGFSLGATLPAQTEDGEPKKVPSSEDAKKILADLIGFTEDIGDASLSDIADIVREETGGGADYSNTMTSFFINNFTGCIPTEAQKAICDLPWRSVFTTNYDDIFERGNSKGGLLHFSPQARNLDITPGVTPVYHLHGRAADLTKPRTLEGFVLSETDYLEIAKHNEAIYTRFFADIHSASEVVFIGYSLRDIEIASRLFSIRSIQRKVSIIARKDASQLSLRRLRKFGTVFEIGSEGFADKIVTHKESRKDEPARNVSFLKRVATDTPAPEVVASDVDDLFLTGQFDFSAYFSQLISLEREGAESSDLYSVDRSKAIARVFDEYSAGRYNRFLIAADVGNGKTCYLKQLAGHATKFHGFDVFQVSTQVQEVYAEIEAIIASGKKSMFLVDGFTRYRKIISFISPRLGDRCVLVVTDPETNDEYAGDKLFAEFNSRAYLINISKMTLEEVKSWNSLLERWGLWGDRIELDAAKRDEFIQKDCSSENRSLILALFKQSSISAKIDALVRAFVANSEDYEQGLIAVLIRALCHQHVQWSHIVSWLGLNEREIEARIKNSGFRSLTEGERRWHEVTSHELAGYILNNYDFDAEKIVDSYCRIVAETASLSQDRRNGTDSYENLKELMRYRFLTRLFTSSENQESLIDTVYQRLSKNKTIRAKELFWLQWAMARLDLGDVTRAESYLESAAGLAAKYNRDHSLIQIEDQFARLYFKKGANKKARLDEGEIFRAIEITSTAINRDSEILIHPMRSSTLIYDLIEDKCDDMSPELTSDLLKLIKEMINIAENASLDRTQRGEKRRIKQALKKSLLVLQNL